MHGADDKAYQGITACGATYLRATAALGVYHS